MSVNHTSDNDSILSEEKSISIPGLYYNASSTKSFIRCSVKDIITPSEKGEAALTRLQQISYEIEAPGKSGTCFMKQVQTDFSSTLCYQGWSSLNVATNQKVLSKGPSTRLSIESHTSDLRNLGSIVNGGNQDRWSDRSVTHSASDYSRRRHGMLCKKFKLDTELNKLKAKTKEPRRKSISAIKNSKHRPLEWKYILLLPLVPLALLLGLCLTILQGSYTSYEACSVPLVLSGIEQALQKEVIGQEEAITKLIHIFLAYQSAEKVQPPVIIVSGGNGVGKSLVSSIISRAFPPPGKSQLVVAPPLPSPDKIVHTFSLCGENIVVIDDLTLRSVTDVIRWVYKLNNEAQFQDKIVWIMLVFNVQTWHENLNQIEDDQFHRIMEERSKLLHDLFGSSGISRIELVHFPPLKHLDIQECIRRALKIHGFPTEGEVFMKSLTHIHKDRHEGCKRVWSQVAAYVKSDIS